ncbi:MAG: mechanosensitive ion channel family protein [Campylobacterales bacterium]
MNSTESPQITAKELNIEEGIKQEIAQIEKFYDMAMEFLVSYSFQIVGAVFILLVGLFIANKFGRFIENLLVSKKLDVTLSRFIGNFLKISVIVGVVIIALGKLGIQITPFIAALGAAGLGASLALQGTLSNYGAGLAIIISKTFKVGDTLSIQEYQGEVKNIKLGYTILETEDLEEITIPNRHIVGEVLVNSFENRIVEATVGIDYENDPKIAIDTIMEVLNSVDEVAKDPKAQVGIKEFGDGAIIIEYRYWAPTKSYFQTIYKINMEVFEALKASGINIPFPTYNIITHKQ